MVQRPPSGALALTRKTMSEGLGSGAEKSAIDFQLPRF